MELLRQAEHNDSVVAVILTGSAGYFTSGADLKEMASDNSTAPTPTTTKNAQWLPMIDRPVGRFMSAMLSFPKLLVAAVNGPAVGIGVTLLPHCDVTYAYGGDRPVVTERAETAVAETRKVIGHEAPLAATFWTPFFRLAIVPELCSSVTFPEILVRSSSH